MSNNISFGNQSNANGENSISIGDNSLAEFENTISIGHRARSTSLNSISIGPLSESKGDNSISIGENSESSEKSIAIGFKSKSNNTSSISIGDQSNANGEKSIAIGYKSFADNSNSIAIGDDSNCNSSNCISMGYHVTIDNNSENSISIGDQSTCSSSNSVSMGYSTVCGGDNSVCIGDDSSVTSSNSVSIGHESSVENDNTIILGNSNQKNCDVVYSGRLDTNTPGFPSHSNNNSIVEGQIMMLKNRLVLAKKNSSDNIVWHYLTEYDSNVVSKVNGTESEIVNSTKFNIVNANCYNKPNYVTGQGINIGVIDAGIPHNHPDFNNFLKIASFEKSDGKGGDIEINGGALSNHGTGVASVIASRRLSINETDYILPTINSDSTKNTHGIAFNSLLLDIPQTSDREANNTYNERYKTLGADIICNSWGNSTYLDTVTFSTAFHAKKTAFIYQIDQDQITSSDGPFIFNTPGLFISSSNNGNLHLWDIGDQNLSYLYGLGNSSDKRHLNSVTDFCTNCSVRFDGDNKDYIQNKPGYDINEEDGLINPKFIFSVSEEKAIIWKIDGTTGNDSVHQTLLPNTDQKFHKIGLSILDKYLIISDKDGKLSLFILNETNGQYALAQTFVTNNEVKTNIKFKHSTQDCFIVSEHSGISIYKINTTTNKIETISETIEEKHTDWIDDILFSLDDSLMLSASRDKTIQIYYKDSDNDFQYIHYQTITSAEEINSISLTGDMSFIIAGCNTNIEKYSFNTDTELYNDTPDFQANTNITSGSSYTSVLTELQDNPEWEEGMDEDDLYLNIVLTTNTDTSITIHSTDDKDTFEDDDSIIIYNHPTSNSQELLYIDYGDHIINYYLGSTVNGLPRYLAMWFNDTNNKIVNVFASGNECYSEPCTTAGFPSTFNCIFDVDGTEYKNDNYNDTSSPGGINHPIDHWICTIGITDEGKEWTDTNRAGRAKEYSISAKSKDVNVATFDINKSSNGVSYAAPAVCGGLALVMENFPDLTPAQCVSRLLKTATYDDNLQFCSFSTIIGDDEEDKGLATIWNETTGTTTDFSTNGYTSALESDRITALLKWLTEDEKTKFAEDNYEIERDRILEIIAKIILGDNVSVTIDNNVITKLESSSSFSFKGGKTFNDNGDYMFDLETQSFKSPPTQYYSYSDVSLLLGVSNTSAIFKHIFGYGVMNLEKAMDASTLNVSELNDFLLEKRSNVYTFSERNIVVIDE
jgi:hypothetical protein